MNRDGETKFSDRTRERNGRENGRGEQWYQESREWCASSPPSGAAGEVDGSGRAVPEKQKSPHSRCISPPQSPGRCSPENL